LRERTARASHRGPEAAELEVAGTCSEAHDVYDVEDTPLGPS